MLSRFPEPILPSIPSPPSDEAVEPNSVVIAPCVAASIAATLARTETGSEAEGVAAAIICAVSLVPIT